MPSLPAPRRPSLDDLDPLSASRARASRPRALDEPSSQSDSGRWGRVWALLMASWLAWRYRRQLAPIVLMLAVVLAAGIGHLVNPDLAWVPLTAGGVVTTLAALYAHRPIHRWYAIGAGVASLWAAAAWWVGLTDPVVLLSLAALIVTALVVRRAHLPRSRVEIVGGSWLPWQWEAWRFRLVHGWHLRRVVRDWPLIATRAKVPGVTVRRAATDIEGDHYELHVDLHGLAVDDLQRGLRRIASGLEARQMTTRIEPDVEYEHLARITWARPDAAVAGWEPDAQPEEEADDEPVSEARRPEPMDPAEIRFERLLVAVSRAGPEAVSARELARLAGLPHDWVARHIGELASPLGLRRVKGGWQRLAVEESA